MLYFFIKPLFMNIWYLPLFSAFFAKLPKYGEKAKTLIVGGHVRWKMFEMSVKFCLYRQGLQK